MYCWHCKTQELIWGGDDDLEDDVFCMVTNLSCPKCDSQVDVYLPKEGKKREKSVKEMEAIIQKLKNRIQKINILIDRDGAKEI
jgi:hypothetical protein